MPDDDPSDEYNVDPDDLESEGIDSQLAEFESSGIDDEEELTIDFYGGKWMSAFPLAFFIAWAIVQTAIFRIGDLSGLVAGILIAIIVGMLFVKGSWKGYANTLFAGMTQTVAATAIVAWLWAGMFASTVQAGEFVSGLVWVSTQLGVGEVLFPAATFILAGLLATGIGTGFGTTIAFTTLFFPAGLLIGVHPALLFGAILSGAALGDNLAPVSDTTIVSAVTQDSDIGGVVASRFKYVLMAAIPAFFLFIVASSFLSGVEVTGNAEEIFIENSNPLGLVHLLSMGAVLYTAISGRHIVEAISWGLIVAFILNIVTGLAPVSAMIVFQVPESASVATSAAWLPFVEIADTAAVGGSIYDGATAYFAVSVLVLLIVAAAQIMVRGGAFEALLDFSLNRVAKNVRSAEMTLVSGITAINAVFTINTAAEIAIAPYVSNLGERFNINGYRRANLLDGCTVGIAYIFPWSGAVLLGYSIMVNQLPQTYDWYTQAMIVNPADVFPFVFHGWLLTAVMFISAWTGFGREYALDRETGEVARV